MNILGYEGKGEEYGSRVYEQGRLGYGAFQRKMEWERRGGGQMNILGYKGMGEGQAAGQRKSVGQGMWRKWNMEWERR